ncbi:MAG TPA: sigma-70 family RNA polymerase sigma factor [Anaeromyxobacteraceae bacterium]|nr:sigma-70 family RNA polymerase sigma factor [Anaeromyxobacteraceae bacterium]
MQVEEQVKAALARGDSRAAATIALRAHGDALRTYLRSLLPPDDADDVYCAAAEQIWKSLPRFRFECPLRAWSFRLAWRAVGRFHRDPYRRRGRRLLTSEASRIALSVPTSSPGLGGRREAFRRLQAELSPRDQTLLYLRAARALEWDEVAAVLSRDGEAVTSAALRKRYERLKKRLVEEARAKGLLA